MFTVEQEIVSRNENGSPAHFQSIHDSKSISLPVLKALVVMKSDNLLGRRNMTGLPLHAGGRPCDIL